MRFISPAFGAACLAAFLTATAGQAADLTPPVVSYKIHCRLDDATRTIEGHELLTWTNTAPRPARTLEFHLYLNAFRNTESTFFKETGGSPRGWGSVTISRMSDVAGNDLLADRRYISPDDGNSKDRTVALIPLPAPVAPGQTASFTMDFVSKLPPLGSRTGYAGDFFLAAHWFPQIGVWQAGGWNCHQYRRHAEFPADFGDYDLTLDLASRFKGKVCSTGQLLDERDAPGGRVIEHLHADSVTDFAWAAYPESTVFNDRFEQKGSAPLSLTLFCPPGHRDQAQRYFSAAKAALSNFGKWYGPYPYSNLTIVDPPWNARGADGASYPTLVVAGTSDLAPIASRQLEANLFDTLARQYFGGLLAPNDSPNAGLAAYAAGRLLGQLYSTLHPAFSLFGLPIVFWPAEIHPPYAVAPQGTAANRVAGALATFEAIAGEKATESLMSGYTHDYRFRAPAWSDFIATANRTTQKNWTPLFEWALTPGNSVDYAVVRATSIPAHGPAGIVDVDGREKDVALSDAPALPGWDSAVVVERHGRIALPVEVLLKFAGGRSYRTTWDGESGHVRFLVTNGPRLLEASVDPAHRLLIDSNPNNNDYRLKSDASAANLWTARADFWAANLFDLFMELW